MSFKVFKYVSLNIMFKYVSFSIKTDVALQLTK